jgi:hypothetical protein
VCCPSGAHPTTAHFLALHKNLFPVIGLKEIEPTAVNKLGLVDAQRKARVGPAEILLNTAAQVCICTHIHM